MSRFKGLQVMRVEQVLNKVDNEAYWIARGQVGARVVLAEGNTRHEARYNFTEQCREVYQAMGKSADIGVLEL